MEEQANQSEVTTLDDFELVPEGIEWDEENGLQAVEETTETAEEVETDQEPTEEPEEVEDQAEETEEVKELLEDMQVKFMHETKALKDIPKEDLQSYIQKGMNYDRLQGKLKEVQDKTTEFDEVAKMFDMDASKLLDSLKQQYFDHKAKEESRNPNDVRKEYESGRKSIQDIAIDRFNEAYPDVSVDSLDQSIIDAVAMGDDMKSAYESFVKDTEITKQAEEIQALNDKISELERQVEVGKQNDKVKKKGVVKKVSGADDQTDSFLQGLLGD